jgi:hypothetical protein
MATDEQVNETITDWLNGLTADFCDEGIVTLVQRPDKYLNRKGDYVEKLIYVISSSDTKII